MEASLVSPLKTRIGLLLNVLALPVDDPDLARSQLAAFSKQIPLLYGILMVNTLGLAATHARTAPLILTLVIPLCLCALCCLRGFHWLRLDANALSGAQAVKRLRNTMRLVGILGAAFTGWSLSLYGYGDAYERCQVSFYMSITVISCILCLMHLRGAALLLTAIVLAPFTIFFVATGNPVLVAMALNMILVACGLIAMMLRNYNDFAGLIRSRKMMLGRQHDMQSLSDENHHLAYSDALTGLPNRRSFLARLDEAILAANREPMRFAVALLDLDGFKSVNDVHGHAAGDELLIEIGRRLKGLATARAFFARLGGDEFGMILTGTGSDDEIIAFGQEVLGLLRSPCLARDAMVAIGGSIGVAIYPEAGRTAEDLFERADYALYYVKQTQKGRVVIFCDSHESVVRRNGRIEQALRRADLEQELELVYQPIIDTMTNRVLAFEALARWHSPDIGPVGPQIFLPIAEQRQLMAKMTETLLVKALQAALPWPRHVTLCFNLSTCDVMSPATMAAIRMIVLKSGIEPSRVEFEITETAAMEDFTQVSASIALLRELGARIALDDFGSGFSSLARLLLLKVDKIKVDKSFVSEIGHSRPAPSIIRSVVNLCEDLGIDCVVEGVETEFQAAILKGLGCRWMQGYLFSKPVSASSIALLLAEDAGPPVVRPRAPVSALS
jgi:diguanylate cyclase (GGDEF)-like protein